MENLTIKWLKRLEQAEDGNSQERNSKTPCELVQKQQTERQGKS